jgi:Holliday junction resolvase-like predicted endonuclease
MKINKSTRHAKITGDFGETLVLYWLSKYGFECAPVDHTGIDIIARNPHTREIMGISVKSRSRAEGTEEDYLSIPNDNFAKAEAACAAFGCVPYFSIVVDAGEVIRGFILPMSKLLALFPKGNAASGWKMTEPYLKRYAGDPEIQAFEFRTKTGKWWGQPDAPPNGGPATLFGSSDVMDGPPSVS